MISYLTSKSFKIRPTYTKILHNMKSFLIILYLHFFFFSLQVWNDCIFFSKSLYNIEWFGKFSAFIEAIDFIHGHLLPMTLQCKFRYDYGIFGILSVLFYLKIKLWNFKPWKCAMKRTYRCKIFHNTLDDIFSLFPNS